MPNVAAFLIFAALTQSPFSHCRINGRPWTGNQPSRTFFGRPQDPLIRVSGVEAFFGDPGKAAPWGTHATRWFGGPFTIKDGVVTLHSGKQQRLARPERRAKTQAPEDGRFVFLKDLVAALGGKYAYNARQERVEITFRPTSAH